MAAGKDATGRAESCSLCSPSGTRRERPAGCWAGERADIPTRARTGLRLNENCLGGEKEARKEARRLQGRAEPSSPSCWALGS